MRLQLYYLVLSVALKRCIKLTEQILQTKQYIGIRNTVASKIEPKHWKYLIFYEIDDKDETKGTLIKSMYECFETSYIIYKTLHGYHAVGLTPMRSQQWGHYYERLENVFKEYYNGNVLRISAKESEHRELFAFSFRFPYIEKLCQWYSTMLHIDKSELPIFGDMPNYKIYFERYYST